MDTIDIKGVEPLPRLVELASDLAPASDRILLIEEACAHDLLPVLLLTHTRLRRHARRPIEAQCP